MNVKLRYSTTTTTENLGNYKRADQFKIHWIVCCLPGTVTQQDDISATREEDSSSKYRTDGLQFCIAGI